MITTEETKMTEDEFLENQAEEARAAMHETWTDLKSTLKETASLDVWARRHPWLVAGAAVAGGFLIATALLAPNPPAETSDEQANAPSSSAASRRRLSWLFGPLFGLLRPVFGQLVSSLISGALGAMTGAMAAEATDAADEEGAAAGEGPVPF